MLISIVVFDDFTDIDVFLMWDLFNRVQHPGWKVQLIGEGPQHRSRTNIPIPMHGSLELTAKSDAVLFASGPGVRRKLSDTQFLSALKLDPQRQLIGSMCAGSLILAALGLLTRKHATTHPSVRELLQAFDVQVVDRPFVREGNVATAAGCLAAPHLVAWVVEQLASEDERDRVLESVQPVGGPSAFVLPHSASQREMHLLRRADW
jgi:transcriptional regulator GlxA family with amidase domain